ncbi:hypothetical protein MIMGU_mgv11b015468mg [Erythranthe guttata]|uniref:GDSL esterase/lipase n=1 Tax=Erythranthe guttata TaxID=4155 RepID=A0A022RU96_ERYGU|nr:hypothetical protein MIMGU_mgv11b015468mg [Erythranthe guttata]
MKTFSANSVLIPRVHITDPKQRSPTLYRFKLRISHMIYRRVSDLKKPPTNPKQPTHSFPNQSKIHKETEEKATVCWNWPFLRFEQPLMACCGYGGPPLNYDSRISCGQTKVVNGSSVTVKGCDDSTEYVNWDGIHYTEAANQYVASQVLMGKYSDPPFADKMPFLLKLKF